MLPIRDHPSGLAVKIRVQPRSSRNQIFGLYADAFKIKVTAPPGDNMANRMCTQVIADRLGVAPSSIEILSGQTARTKSILIRCDSADRPRLRKLLENLASR